MRVLYLVTDDWYFLSHRLHLAQAARDAGAEVTVVTAPGPQVAEIEREGFRHRPLTFRRGKASQPLNLLTLRELTRIYRSVRPDLVHHVSFLPIFYGSWAADRAGVPAVVNAVTGLGHAFVPGGWSRAVLRWAVARAYRSAIRRGNQLTIFQNEEDRRHFVEHGLVEPGACVVVPGSGVDLARFAAVGDPPRGEPPRVVHASRMLWSKGVADTVAASRLLRERGVSHRLVLAGRQHPSNPESIPTERLRGWEAEGLATWLGHVEDVPALLASATVVCLPTIYREGVPMALLEASAAARPAVTTDVPGCREVVTNEETGYLVPPGRPHELADALERVLTDPERARSMGAAARERAAARFSKELVLERTLACYRELLESAGARWSRAAAAPGSPAAGTQGLEAPPASGPR